MTAVVIIFILIVVVWAIFEGSSNQAKRKQEEYEVKVKTLISSAGDFNTTNKIEVSSDTVFLIDDTNNKLCLLRPQFKKIYNYSQIMDVELNINEKTIVSKSNMNTIGRALVGGVLAGGVGAIVGGLSGSTKTENKISKIAVKLLFQDLNFPSFTITYFDYHTAIGGKPVDPSYCAREYSQAEEFVNIMSVIIDKGKKLETPPNEKTPAIQKQELASVADELRKLATLRDEGILTQEEFEEQKVKLLG